MVPARISGGTWVDQQAVTKPATVCGLLIRRPQVRALLGPPRSAKSKTNYAAAKEALGLSPDASRKHTDRLRQIARALALGLIDVTEADRRTRASVMQAVRA